MNESQEMGHFGKEELRKKGKEFATNYLSMFIKNPVKLKGKDAK